MMIKKSPRDSRQDPNVFLTDKCVRRCLYCSALGEDRLMTGAQALEVLNAGFKSLVFEGGEPLLRRDLEKWTRLAVKKGASDISVLTNGLLLTGRRLRSLKTAGVRHFHFNFPSHVEKLHDLLTGASGKFSAQLRVIRAAAASGPETAVLVCVINSLNYRHLPAYAEFAAREFPGIFYIAFNFIKVKGLVKKNLKLVPRLAEVKPFLLKALARAKALGIPCLVDGVPMCFLDGFEAYCRDADRLLRGDRVYLGEKAFVKACRGCAFARICAGPRADYVALYGSGGFRARPRGAAGLVIKKVLQGQLSLNRM